MLRRVPPWLVVPGVLGGLRYSQVDNLLRCHLCVGVLRFGDGWDLLQRRVLCFYDSMFRYPPSDGRSTIER